MSFRWVLAAVLVCAVAVSPALALDLGDPAPPLKIKDWVKGKAVDLKEGKGKTVYVVEFWATWCGPCRQTIPYLTELQKKFKDKGVMVIGISDEPAATVKPFVEKMGKDMDYVVAVDDKEATNTAYMKAFKVQGIPHAFIVDKTGAVVWSGHPMNGMDQAIEEILAGKYDLEAAKKAAQIDKMAPEYFQLVAKGGKSNLKKAAKLGKKIVKYGGKNAMLMNQFAWIILTGEGLKHRDLKLAMKAAQAAYDACEGKDAAIVDTYARALWDNGKQAEAIKYQKDAVKLCEDKEMAAELKKTLEGYEKKAAAGGEGDGKGDGKHKEKKKDPEKEEEDDDEED